MYASTIARPADFLEGRFVSRWGSVCAALIGLWLGAWPVLGWACDGAGSIDYGQANVWTPAYSGYFSFDDFQGQVLAKSDPGPYFAALITQGEVAPEANFCVEVAFPAGASGPAPEAGLGFASNGRWVFAAVNRDGVANIKSLSGGGLWKSLAPELKIEGFSAAASTSLRLIWKAPPRQKEGFVDDRVVFYVGDQLVATLSIPPDDRREMMLYAATGGGVVRFPCVLLEP